MNILIIIIVASVSVIAILLILFLTRIHNKKQVLKMHLKYRKLQDWFDQIPIKDSDTVFLGDSHTKNFELNYILSDFLIKNRGVSGDLTAGVLKRIDEVVAGRPKKVFIEIGFNDAYFGVEVDVICKNIETIISLFKESSPGTAIFLLSLFPSSTVSVEKIDLLNTHLLKFCTLHGCRFINVFEVLNDNGALRDAFDSGDGIHLNEKGYRAWAELMRPHLVA